MAEISDDDIKPIPTPWHAHLIKYYREIIVLAVIILLLYAWL